MILCTNCLWKDKGTIMAVKGGKSWGRGNIRGLQGERVTFKLVLLKKGTIKKNMFHLQETLMLLILKKQLFIIKISACFCWRMWIETY